MATMKQVVIFISCSVLCQYSWWNNIQLLIANNIHIRALTKAAVKRDQKGFRDISGRTFLQLIDLGLSKVPIIIINYFALYLEVSCMIIFIL